MLPIWKIEKKNILKWRSIQKLSKLMVCWELLIWKSFIIKPKTKTETIKILLNTLIKNPFDCCLYKIWIIEFEFEFVCWIYASTWYYRVCGEIKKLISICETLYLSLSRLSQFHTTQAKRKTRSACRKLCLHLEWDKQINGNSWRFNSTHKWKKKKNNSRISLLTIFIGKCHHIKVNFICDCSVW